MCRFDRFNWLFLACCLILLNISLLAVNVNADNAFALRYTNIMWQGYPFSLLIQPGHRFFPELFYSHIGYAFTVDPILWSRIVLATNSLVLTCSIYYFVKTLGLSNINASITTGGILCSIPILNLLHPTLYHYYVFSHGIHGFLISYILIVLALFYRLLKEPLNMFQVISLILLCALCIISNISFLLASVVPFGGYLVMIMLRKDVLDYRPLTQWLMIMCCSFVISYLLQIWLGGLSLFSFEEIKTKPIKEEVFLWFQQSRMVEQLLDIKVSGYFLYVLVASVISSIITLTYHKRNSFLNGQFFVNSIFLSWIPLYLLAFWYLGAANIRHIPFILLFAGPVLVLNILNFIGFNMFLHKLKVAAVILLATVASILFFQTSYQPYVHYAELYDHLQELKNQKKIGYNGLSNYWVSGVSFNNGFNIQPITYSGEPLSFANDILASWDWTEDKKKERKYTFIVNVCTNKCHYEQDKLVNYFGKYSEVDIFESGDKSYEIYIYPNGAQTQSYYQSLMNLVNKKISVSL